MDRRCGGEPSHCPCLALGGDARAQWGRWGGCRSGLSMARTPQCGTLQLWVVVPALWGCQGHPQPPCSVTFLLAKATGKMLGGASRAKLQPRSTNALGFGCWGLGQGPVEPFLMGFGGEEQELLLQERLSRWEHSAPLPPVHKPLLPPGRSASPEVCPQPHTGTIPWQLRPKSQVTHVRQPPGRLPNVF